MIALRLLKVAGHSMRPELEHGDFVVVSEVPFWFRPARVGDLVAFRQPGYGTMVKRVASVAPDGSRLDVVGRHEASLDSRQLGPVPRERLLGKVVWRIARSP
jgi:nickel-type superoxide dismutase maturation protease